MAKGNVVRGIRLPLEADTMLGVLAREMQTTPSGVIAVLVADEYSRRALVAYESAEPTEVSHEVPEAPVTVAGFVRNHAQGVTVAADETRDWGDV